MRKLADLTGQKFGRLTVVKRVETDKPRVFYVCKCECGKERIVQASHLQLGHTTSCGCSRTRHITNSEKRGRHTRLYEIYTGMKKRCYNPKFKQFMNYGGRGITICDEWIDKTIVPNSCHSTKGWLTFREWALTHGYRDDLTIDRIDVNKGYEPSNCRWASMRTQQNNRTNNHLVTYKGRTQSLVNWCRELNLNYDTVKCRLNRQHWTVEKAFEIKAKTVYSGALYG